MSENPDNPVLVPRTVHSLACDYCDGSGLVVEDDDEDNCSCIYDQAGRCGPCQKATTWERPE